LINYGKKINELQNELILTNKKLNDLRGEKQQLEVENQYRIEINQNISKLSEIKEYLKIFMLRIMYGKISVANLSEFLIFKIEKEELTKLHHAALHTPLPVRKKALAILYHLCGISQPVIIEFLFMGRNTMKRYIRKFEEKGMANYLIDLIKI
jgi:hypothetical protein